MTDLTALTALGLVQSRTQLRTAVALVILKSTHRNSAQNPVHTATRRYGKLTVLGHTKQSPSACDGGCQVCQTTPSGTPEGTEEQYCSYGKPLFYPVKPSRRGIGSPGRAAVPGSHRRRLQRVRNSKCGTDELSSVVFRGKKASLLHACRACATLCCVLPVTNDNVRLVQTRAAVKNGIIKA